MESDSEEDIGEFDEDLKKIYDDVSEYCFYNDINFFDKNDSYYLFRNFLIENVSKKMSLKLNNNLTKRDAIK